MCETLFFSTMCLPSPSLSAVLQLRRRPSLNPHGHQHPPPIRGAAAGVTVHHLRLPAFPLACRRPVEVCPGGGRPEVLLLGAFSESWPPVGIVTIGRVDRCASKYVGFGRGSIGEWMAGGKW